MCLTDRFIITTSQYHNRMCDKTAYISIRALHAGSVQDEYYASPVAVSLAKPYRTSKEVKKMEEMKMADEKVEITKRMICKCGRPMRKHGIYRCKEGFFQSWYCSHCGSCVVHGEKLDIESRDKI